MKISFEIPLEDMDDDLVLDLIKRIAQYQKLKKSDPKLENVPIISLDWLRESNLAVLDIEKLEREIIDPELRKLSREDQEKVKNHYDRLVKSWNTITKIRIMEAFQSILRQKDCWEQIQGIVSQMVNSICNKDITETSMTELLFFCMQK